MAEQSRLDQLELDTLVPFDLGLSLLWESFKGGERSNWREPTTASSLQLEVEEELDVVEITYSAVGFGEPQDSEKPNVATASYTKDSTSFISQ